MNPKYQFRLDGNISYPIWGDNLSKVIKREDGQMFFRESLNTPLVYNGSEYAYILAQAYDTIFNVVIEYSTDGGANYATYWQGYFKKEDCKVDMDAMTVEVTPNVLDEYTKILESWDNEFDLTRIDNPPAMQSIKATRRPALQLYLPGQSSIFTFVSGMYWEAACEAERDDNKLINDYHFNRVTNKLIAITDQTGGMPELFEGTPPATPNDQYTLLASNGYKFRYNPQAGQYGNEEVFSIYDDQNTLLYYYRGETDYSGFPREIAIPPVGSGQAIKVSIRNLSVYARLLLDTDSIPGSVYLDMQQDIIEFNRNYRYVCPIGFSTNYIGYTSQKSSTPTPYGLYEPGIYYKPATFGSGREAFPVTPEAWGTMSVWADATFIYETYDEWGRKIFSIKNAYPLGAVIKSLLGQIDPSLLFSETSSSSAFLYSDTPIESNDGKKLFITPKTNITNASYDNPAQRAKITLKNILDMLRDTFRCYWFIENNILKVEHIEYFRRGGSYSNTPSVDIDLTTYKTERNNKKWAFALDKYTYDKSQIPGRYTFSWMDEVTEPFEGYPMEMLNGVTFQPRGGGEEAVSIANFTTDIDYLMLNPNAVSKDGFCLLKAGLVETVTPSNPITLTLPDTYPVPSVWTLIEYEAQANEVMYLKLGYTPPVYSNNYTLELLATDENDNVIGSLRGPAGPGAWDISMTHYIVLPQGTAKIKVLFYGGTIVLNTFGPEHTLSVLFYDYYPDGYNAPKHRLLQNGELAFGYMQRYYIYDLAARYYQINGCGWAQYINEWRLQSGYGAAEGIKLTKIQEVSFPAEDDPNTKKLIKTNIGSGNIENITLNLSSRNAKATLGYEPT